MIAQLRHDALNAPTCCSKHHDPHDTAMLTKRFETLTIADCSMQSPIPTECIALTVGLQRYLAHSVPNDVRGPNLEIPSKLICRLHLSHRCRYLEDCNNVHVCREFDLRLHPPPFMMAPLQNLMVTTRTITLGDASYHVTPLAVGEVTDDEFHALCEQQQFHHQRGGGGTSPIQHGGGGSTSTSPFLCGVPYPHQQHDGYGRATPESNNNGGTSPFLGSSSSSPPNIQQQFAMHNNNSNNNAAAAHHHQHRDAHSAAWGAAAGGDAIGTPTNSFSTPPLAFSRAQQHALQHTPSLALGPSSFSSPPSGLPSFIGGDAPPSYSNNIAAAAAQQQPPQPGTMAELIARFGEQQQSNSNDRLAGAAGGSPFLAAADSVGAPPPPPLFSAATGGGGGPLQQHHNLNASMTKHGSNLATSKTLRVYDIRGVPTNSPTPTAAVPPTAGHHHHHPHAGHGPSPSHYTAHSGHGSHASHYGGSPSQHYSGHTTHHHNHHPQQQHHGANNLQHYGNGHHHPRHNNHHGSGASSSGTPSLQGSPVLAAAAMSPLGGPHHHHLHHTSAAPVHGQNQSHSNGQYR